VKFQTVKPSFKTRLCDRAALLLPENSLWELYKFTD